MNRIRPVYSPLEPFVIWENGFSKEEIDKIVAAGELSAFNKGQVGAGGGAVIDSAIRDTDIVWLEQNEANGWIYEKLSAAAARVNYDKFQFDLVNLQPLQYSKYKLDGHYSWHYDSGPNMPEHRKLSVVLGLSDPDSYEGGELQINAHGDQNKPHSLKIKRGDLVVFPSFMGHRVTPVTSGERLTLVGWAVGPKFK